MNLSSVSASAAVAKPVPAPVPKPGQTETQLAVEHMTPQTRELLPDALLDAKIGKGTLAGALNDQVRFRVDRSSGDDPKEWAIIPDSPTAAALMQTTAGADFIKQLRTATESTGSLGRTSNLKGFMLAKDQESVLAGTALAGLDDPTDPDAKALGRAGAKGDTDRAGDIVRGWRSEYKLDASIARAGAWNSEGWITFMPDTSRAMLTAAGAYGPGKTTEARLREAASWTNYLAGNGPHEVQHSVSDPSPTAYQGPAKWIEEGTANVFSRTPVFHTRNQQRAGLDPNVYAGRLAHEPVFDPGWKPWKRPAIEKSKQQQNEKDTARNYGASQVVLRDLARLAGADFRSKAGQERAFELLQEKSMRYTPGVLAKAIIERHNLEPSVYERLRTRIQTAVDVKGGVEAIAEEFGIG